MEYGLSGVIEVYPTFAKFLAGKTQKPTYSNSYTIGCLTTRDNGPLLLQC